jgi:hypothetical protein
MANQVPCEEQSAAGGAAYRLRPAPRHIGLQLGKALALALTLSRHLLHQLPPCGEGKLKGGG